MRRAVLFVFSLLALAASLRPAGAHDSTSAVRRLLMETFDKPESRLSVDAVVVEDDVAIADWSQGELGGRALLRRKDGAWSIALCAGDALKEGASLEKLGLSRPRAQALSTRLGAAERSLAPSLLERFSRFDGIAAVDATGNHSPVDPHHKPIR